MNKVITIKEENIAPHIYLIRGEKIILNYDLAMLYGVETGALKQAVKRNIKRFSGDFMLILTEEEVNNLVSQNVIPSKSYLGGALRLKQTHPNIILYAISSEVKNIKMEFEL